MDFLNNLVRLLTQPPGDLVYFLVTLFALQQALTMLLAVPREARTPNLPRWLWAVGAMLGGRLLLLTLGLLSNIDLLAPNAILPPAEHAIEVVSIALFLWAVVGEVRRRPVQTGVLGVVLAGVLAFYLYDAMSWPAMAAQRAYNGSPTEFIWEGAATILLGLGLLWTALVRPRRWTWYLGVELFWLAGHVAQLGWPVSDLDFASWERLTALVWTPLLAVALHRYTLEAVMHEAAVATHPLRTITPPPAATTFRLDVGALQALLRSIAEARELEPSLILATSKLASILHADVCAIALTDDAMGEGVSLQLIAVHPPSGRLDLPQLTADRYPDLFVLMESNTPHLFTARQAPRWLPYLYEEMGIEGTGPLLVLPMRVEGRKVGMLFLGNPTSQRLWEKESFQLLRLVAADLAAAIDRVQRRGNSILALDEAEVVAEEVTRLKEEQLALQERIVELERNLRSRDREIARLRSELAKRPRTSETELAFWKNEMKELVNDRDMLLRERKRLVQELSELKQRYDAIVEERDRLAQRLEKARREVDQLRARLRQLDRPLETIAGLIVTDAQGHIVVADSMAKEMLGLAENVIGRPLDSLYPDRKWAETIAALLSAESTMRRAHMTLDINNSLIEADMMTLLDASGLPYAVAVTLNSQESLAEEREVLVGMINELRTPMTSIIGYTDLLLAEQVGILNAMQMQFLERVKANIERMGQMLSDLVELVSPEKPHDAIEPEPVDLVHVIEEAIVGMAARFRERRIGVRMDMPEELAPVRADRDSLYQIILRLLSNAVLCSREGSEIVVSARMQGGKDETSFVRISVTDTCGGIAPEDMPRVFRRFYRAQQPLIQGLGERGVGMAMVKALVEANGGRIWVESEQGVGSTFSFILPAYQDVRTTV